MAMEKYGVESRKELLEQELKSLENAIAGMEKIAHDAPILQRKRDIEQELERLRSSEDLA